jgi:hypothetical protein
MQRVVMRSFVVNPLLPVNRARRSGSCLLWKVVLAVLLCCGANIAHAELALPKPFIKALTEGGLLFNKEAFGAFKILPIVPNPHMNYQLAVRSKDFPLEIRYAVWQYDPSKVGDQAPEAIDRGVFTTVLMNIAEWSGRGPMILNTNVFDQKAVQTEFNADWGETGVVVAKKDFGGNFDRCMVVCITKQRTQAFIFYLFNRVDTESATAWLKPVFYTLRFR